MRRVLSAVVLAVSLSALLHAQPEKPNYQQLLAQRTNQLGACNAELGPLQQLQAAVINGQLVEPAKLLAGFKEQFQKANPGKTFGDDFKIADIKEEK